MLVLVWVPGGAQWGTRMFLYAFSSTRDVWVQPRSRAADVVLWAGRTWHCTGGSESRRAVSIA